MGINIKEVIEIGFAKFICSSGIDLAPKTQILNGKEVESEFRVVFFLGQEFKHMHFLAIVVKFGDEIFHLLVFQPIFYGEEYADLFGRSIRYGGAHGLVFFQRRSGSQFKEFLSHAANSRFMVEMSKPVRNLKRRAYHIFSVYCHQTESKISNFRKLETLCHAYQSNSKLRYQGYSFLIIPYVAYINHMSKITKVLIANRGEIALRIMRSLKELGITTVAVYSEADRQSLHVRFADEAVCIGPPPSSESYLRIDKIIEAAKSVGANAIHPGYGFLSEKEGFAKACRQAAIIFIGPSPEAIEIMGSKLAAKEAVAKFNVPLVPGTSSPISNIKDSKIIADKIGYPVLIKASAGGGGKGMRVVENENEFEQQLERATSEALSSFGDGSVFIEKYITNPKHIEFQIFGDQHGNVVHLFERECSIQRRHQKVIEEAPSSALTPELRKIMGEAAVNVAKSCGYYNAGTVEFILDENKNFYFLEMNTRLQVEHPVTEMITGIDLVKLQIQVAQGEKIPFNQKDLSIRGHAIEARVYAEDPANNFLPDIGMLATYKTPKGNGVRVDDGFEQGMTIPYYYDPMIAKLVCHAADRIAAIEKTIRALKEYDITGVETTIDFCRFALNHEAFRSGHFDTNFVAQYFKPELLQPIADHATHQVAVALAAMIVSENQAGKPLTPSRSPFLETGMSEVKKSVSHWKLNRGGGRD